MRLGAVTSAEQGLGLAVGHDVGEHRHVGHAVERLHERFHHARGDHVGP